MQVQTSTNNLELIQNDKNVKIYSWNIVGIRSQLQKKAINLLVEKYPMDILVIQEMRCQEDVLNSQEVQDLIKSLGFEYTYFNLGNRKGFSGVGILSKIKPIQVYEKVDHELVDQMGRFLMLEFNNFYLVNVYQPTCGQAFKFMKNRVTFDEQINRFISNIMKIKSVIYMGDLNVAHMPIDTHKPDPKHPSYTKEEREGFMNLLSLGFKDFFRYKYKDQVKYTYWNYMFNA